jgi:hypothetical protein
MKTKEMSKQQRPDMRFTNFFSSLIRGRILVFTVAALVCCAGVVIAVSAYSNPGTNSGSMPSTGAEPLPPLPHITASAAQDADLNVELVTIKPYGFEPEELKLSKGRFLLAIDNRSRQREVSLQLTSLATSVKSQVTQMAKGNVNWNRLLDLQPGEYVLTEANHPQWTCKITITGN